VQAGRMRIIVYAIDRLTILVIRATAGAKIVIFGLTLVLCFIAANGSVQGGFRSDLFLIVDALTDLFKLAYGAVARALAKRLCVPRPARTTVVHEAGASRTRAAIALKYRLQ
jgi:hypothetical protein